MRALPMNPPTQPLGRRLADWRRKCKLSKKAAAEKTAFHVNTIRNHESGLHRPNAEQLATYARAYETDVPSLLGGPNAGRLRRPKPEFYICSEALERLEAASDWDDVAKILRVSVYAGCEVPDTWFEVDEEEYIEFRSLVAAELKRLIKKCGAVPPELLRRKGSEHGLFDSDSDHSTATA